MNYFSLEDSYRFYLRRNSKKYNSEEELLIDTISKEKRAIKKHNDDLEFLKSSDEEILKRIIEENYINYNERILENPSWCTEEEIVRYFKERTNKREVPYISGLPLDFLEEKLNKIQTEDKILNFLKISEVNNINDSFDFFEFILDNEISDLKISKTLQRLTDNYNTQLLNSISNDLSFFISNKREDLICSFSNEEIENKKSEILVSGLEIPYIKRKPFEELTEEQKKHRLKIEKENPYEPLLDIEKLMFPYYFYQLYKLQIEISNRLNNNKDEIINKSTPFEEIQPKTKSILLNGKKLNLYDRFKIANDVLDMENQIRKLNINDLDKYQLVAYILGCNKDNARDLMNRKYNAKPNDLTGYYNELGLNK